MELDPRKLLNRAKKKLNEYKRVLKIATKPDREEFEMSAKITGAGILIIGAIGFIFYLAANLIPQYL
ncbi:MAG: protein translocase SEC61 complex subunit gamma [Candidatus Nanohaloarchaea archaeon]